MKSRNTRRGFTLIELLVVVLIIGILAAVAMPQYKLAVVKSRASTIFPTLQTLMKAEQVYYLNRGQYTNRFDFLDIDIPGCSFIDAYTLKCGEDFLLGVVENTLTANYCPRQNDNSSTCHSKKDFIVQVSFSNAGSWRCEMRNNSSLGRKVCNSLVL